MSGISATHPKVTWAVDANFLDTIQDGDHRAPRKPIPIPVLIYAAIASVALVIGVSMIDGNAKSQLSFVEARVQSAVTELSALGGEGANSMIGIGSTAIEGSAKNNKAMLTTLGQALATVDSSLHLDAAHAELTNEGKIAVHGQALCADIGTAAAFRDKLGRSIPDGETTLSSVERSSDPTQPGVSMRFDIVLKGGSK